MKKYRNLPKFNEAGVHFITTKTYRNTPCFLDKTCCDILIEELDFYRKQYEFKVSGYVIMPDHLHLLVGWDIDEKKNLTISKIVQGIKSHSARRILEYLGMRVTDSRLSQGTQPTLQWTTLKIPVLGRQGPLTLPKEYPHQRISNPKYKIWQTGFYDFNILYEEKLWGKINYIHENPFKDARITNPQTYPYSSKLFYETGKGNLLIDYV